MAEFKKRLFVLAGAATVFAGMAFGQSNCTDALAGNPQANAVFLRAEGTNEQVADLTITCDKTASNTLGMTVTVYLSPSVTITSASVGSGGGFPKSETTAIAPAGNSQGTVSANSVTFSIASTPAAAAGTFTVTITNIKVNASLLPAGTGVPTAISETIFVGGPGVVPAVLGSTPNVAYVTNGISGIKSSPIAGQNSIASNSICQPIYNGGGNFNVNFGEGFGNAFKLAGTAAGNAAVNSWFTNNTETGYGYTAGGGNNGATTATRVKIIFNNIPANIAVYVPTSITATAPSTGVLWLTSSETGAFSAVAGSTANGAPGSAASNKPGDGVTGGALTVTNGSATAIYEYRGTGGTAGAVGPSDPSQESYAALVWMVASAGAVPAPAGSVTATVSFAPIGASSNVPNFVSGASTATVNGSSFSACSTTLLFPFVTNQLGFDTGIAISNTSSDLLNGGTKSVASAASGTCSLTFFGSSAPSAVTTPMVTSGTSWTAAASTVAPGFQGYAIASCNFLYAHGFAYVVYNLTQNNGAAMGYLADVITSDRKSPVTSLSATFTTPAGGIPQITALSYSGTTSVSSTNPESWGH